MPTEIPNAASCFNWLLAVCYLLLASAAMAGETWNVLVLYSNNWLLPANLG